MKSGPVAEAVKPALATCAPFASVTVPEPWLSPPAQLRPLTPELPDPARVPATAPPLVAQLAVPNERTYCTSAAVTASDGWKLIVPLTWQATPGVSARATVVASAVAP